MSSLRAMSPLNIERLESVCVTFIQHQKYRTLSASVIVTINSSFFSVYGTHCTLSSDSSILFIVIRFVNLRILSSLSGHFEIFSDVLSTPVVSIIHTSLMIRKQNNWFHQSEQTFHLLLTSPLICFLETVWSRIPHTYSSSYENCPVWSFLNVDHLGIHHDESNSIMSKKNIRRWSDCSISLNTESSHDVSKDRHTEKKKQKMNHSSEHSISINLYDWSNTRHSVLYVMSFLLLHSDF